MAPGPRIRAPGGVHYQGCAAPHLIADAVGSYSYTVGGLPPALSIQTRAVEFDPTLGIVQLSNIATLLL